MDLNILARRHQRLREAIGPDAAAIVASPAPALRSADGDYPYRASSNVIYLSGFAEPRTVVLLLPEGRDPSYVLFVPPRDPALEQWTGRRAGVRGAVERYGAHAAHPLDVMAELLPLYLSGIDTVYLPFTADHGVRDAVFRATARLRGRKRKFRAGPRRLGDLDLVMGLLRLTKDAAELELMRKAAQISVAGHLAGREVVAPGVHEYEVEAAINHAFRRAGASGPAYETIVGAGDNATILHYVENDAVIGPQDAVLIDAGAEYQHYAGDITRTWPASGRFTPEQRALYEVVLAAELAAIETCRTGNHVRSPHDKVLEVLTDGLLDLGLLTGDRDAILEAEHTSDPDAWAFEAFDDDGKPVPREPVAIERPLRRFFMHGTSHYLGLDTHDVSEYYRPDDEPLPMQPGMVLTIEPGLYVSPDDEDAPEAFRGIGIRIEDDVHVTTGDPEVLTSGVPKRLEDIER